MNAPLPDAKPEASKPEGETLADKARKEAREWISLLSVFIPLYLLFTTFFYEQRVIPSESMVPGLQVGDRVGVAKFAYGYDKFSVPYGIYRLLPLGSGRIWKGEPKRGDVVVFMHPHTNRVMIKRLIGLPGDQVQMRGEELFLNGEPVSSEFVRRLRLVRHEDKLTQAAQEYRETIGDASWLVHQWTANRPSDDTPLFIVPEGHVFFMGDNRDNSLDGRALSGHCRAENGVIDKAGCTPNGPKSKASIGFVPMDHLIGRAETVLFTTKRCRKIEGVDCPPKRLWRGL